MSLRGPAKRLNNRALLLIEDVVMTLMDFAPLSRSSIGFDLLFDIKESAANYEQPDLYPPCNIGKTGEDL
jgi:molecular chaperone IbpA